jgi:hypothetical protein
VLQLLGEKPSQSVTLTHVAQVRRFVGDLVRIVKRQPKIRLALKDFAPKYKNMNYRDFEVVDYGVCCPTGLLHGLPDGVVNVSCQFSV